MVAKTPEIFLKISFILNILLNIGNTVFEIEFFKSPNILKNPRFDKLTRLDNFINNLSISNIEFIDTSISSIIIFDISLAISLNIELINLNILLASKLIIALNTSFIKES